MAYETKEITNRKAKFEYQFLQEFDAGISLLGTEVKSVRTGNANMSDAYCYWDGTHMLVKNLFIGEYEHGTIYNHEPKRDRILLLKKTEIKKILKKISEKGFTLVPYKLFISDRGFVKLQVMLAQGKKNYDKRDSIKARDNKRELDRMKKIYG